MCDACYKRGYNDFPKWVGSTEHPNSYSRGWHDRKKELGGTGYNAPSTAFCQKCYDRGLSDGRVRIWAPPELHGGHFESYKKGYNKRK